MKLRLDRTQRGATCTIGNLYVDGKWECFTLEDVVRKGPKVYGETAIPAGTYTVQITHSKRFNRDLPLLLSVPGFEGIRIHPGNSASDTEGCILVGKSKSLDRVYNSRDAFNALFDKMRGAKDTITIEIL